MPTVTVYNLAREKVDELVLKDDIFDRPVNPHILHEVVTAFRDHQRLGTASTKGRSDVRGGGKKPFRQKGTGRARAGTRTSPLMRKGGVVFGPHPRDYQTKVNKKVKKLAMKMALSSKWQSDHLLVLEDFNLEEIKTQNFLRILNQFALKKSLILTDGENLNLEKSARNVSGVKVLRAESLNVQDVLKYEHLVLLKPTIPIIEETLSR